MIRCSSTLLYLRGVALVLGLAVTLGACASSRTFVDEAHDDWEAVAPPPADSLSFRVFLAGNLGAAPDAEAPALDLLASQLAEAGANSAAVFLGDQVSGPLPDSLATGRAEAERGLGRLIGAVEGYEGRVVVIPGDQDAHGADALARQAAYLRARLGDDVFIPPSGLAGPIDLKLADGLALFVLDTGWWLRDKGDRETGEVEGREGEFEVESELDVLNAVHELMVEYDDDRILVVGHHPVFANGAYGGHFTVRQHLFPLTDLWEPLYLPLPVVGSLYPLARTFFPRRQDLRHPEYRELREGLVPVIEEHDGIVYAAAHERGLQYTPLRTDAVELQHHVLSGGAVEGEPMAAGFGAGFAYGHAGFASLQFYTDDTMWLEFWAPDGAGGGEVVFRTQLEEPRSEEEAPEVPDVDPATLPDYTDSTRVVTADPGLGAGAFKRFLLGDSYRDVWTTPVEVSVLDLGREAGGLRPVKRGGGYQTVSLRVEDADEREHVLRQVRKRSGLLVPPPLRGTFAEDAFSDQLQTTNPYAALVVPPLAAAAGIYHTLPEIVVVPDDPRLGRYREDFAGTLVLFEERADDFHEEPRFGGAEDVDSSVKLFQELREDNDTRVDQPFFLRNRLFDLLIGDWDRHQDQWRWAQFEPYQLDSTLTGEARTQGKVYRAIPRDRDQVFFKLTGLLPRIAQFAVEGLQDFDEDYGDLIGLTQNALELDRRFLNELTREDWRRIAADLQGRLTDEAIRDAFAVWPSEVEALHGDWTRETLRSRRDQLVPMADEVYELLAGTVDVVGSDKHERFVVRRLSDDETEVTVYKTSKEGENRKPIYHRVFRTDETDEIRLYGLGGRDRFELSGDHGGPYVRAVGGPDHDTFTDTTGRRRAHFYDTESGNDVEPGRARVTLDDDPANNRFDPDDFAYPYLAILPFVGYDATDGPFLGATATWTRPKFRREPYGHTHSIGANVATFTGAVNVRYSGQWVDRLGSFDVLLDAEGGTPQSIYNFYGLGNDTPNERGADFHRVRLAYATFVAGVEADLAPGATLSLLPTARFVQIDPEEGTILDPDGDAAFDADVLAGADGQLALGLSDRTLNPRQGFRWVNRAGVRAGVTGFDGTYGTLGSDFSVYLSPTWRRQVTLALRAGAEHRVGDAFPFYEAATLGGNENLRGHRRTRFSGRTAAYQNAEFRLQLFGFQTYAANGTLGLIGFVDNGRVWADGEDSSTWHQGYGGGLWANLFDLVLLRGTVGASDEGTFVNIGLGFLY